MSIEKVRAYFKTLGIENRILEFDVSLINGILSRTKFRIRS